MAYYHSRRNSLDSYVDPWGQLFLCVIMDIIGMASYFLPGIGELADIAFAPIEGLFIWFMLDAHPGNATLWAGVGLAEELLPFTDILPACTVAWVIKYNG